MPIFPGLKHDKLLNMIWELYYFKGTRSFEMLSAHLSHKYHWRKIYKQINHIYEKNSQNRLFLVQEILQDNYSSNHSNSPKLLLQFNKLFAQHIDAVLQKNYNENFHKQLYSLVESFESGMLATHRWRELSFLTVAFGLYQIGIVIRRLALAGTLSQNIQIQSKYSVLMEIYTAAMDSGRFEIAEQVIDRMDTIKVPIKKIDELRIHMWIMKGDHNHALGLAEKYYSNRDIQFAGYLKGKRIAIVGPAPDGYLLGDEIDTYDVVVRTNYRGQDKMPPMNEFGRKTNISYYSYTYIKQIYRDLQQSRKFLNDLKFAVTKKSVSPRILAQFENPVLFRNMIQLKNFIFIGQAQMIQNIIFDLLHFDCKEIKLFKSNYFLTDKPYYSSYLTPGHFQILNTNYWLDHATHDLVTQFNFAKSIFNSGQLLFDATSEKVLSHDPKEYIDQIQKLYSI